MINKILRKEPPSANEPRWLIITHAPPVQFLMCLLGTWKWCMMTRSSLCLHDCLLGTRWIWEVPLLASSARDKWEVPLLASSAHDEWEVLLLASSALWWMRSSTVPLLAWLVASSALWLMLSSFVPPVASLAHDEWMKFHLLAWLPLRHMMMNVKFLCSSACLLGTYNEC